MRPGCAPLALAAAGRYAEPMSRSFAFVTVDVFTARRFGGNPLAVFPDAEGLTDAEMQALAGELNLSETTFVLPPDDAANTARVRIFTPHAELPFAGHPNVGTAWVLATRGRDRGGVLRFEELAGLVSVDVQRAGGEMRGARVAAPQTLRVEDGAAASALAPCAGLSASDIVGAPVVASVGTPFTLAEVSADALTRAFPDIGAFRALAASTPDVAMHSSLYLFARDDGARIRARMFAPLAGIAEDPATGSAAAALAALLLHLDGGAALDITISQGIEMGRPSEIRAGARREADGIRAWVGGDCVPVLDGTVSL